MGYKLITKKDITQFAYELNMESNHAYYSFDSTGTDIVVDSPSYEVDMDEIADLELLASFAGLTSKDYTIIKDE